MTKNAFTPKQSEKILNAVETLLIRNNKFYPFAQHVNELFNDKIGSTGQQDSGDPVKLTPEYISELTSFNMYLSGFFFELEDILTEPCQ